jgi:hypothetical protein
MPNLLSKLSRATASRPIEPRSILMSLETYINIVEMENANANTLIPFWIWQEKQGEIYRLLKTYDNNHENDFVFFHLPLIQDCLATCNALSRLIT